MKFKSKIKYQNKMKIKILNNLSKIKKFFKSAHLIKMNKNYVIQENKVNKRIINPY